MSNQNKSTALSADLNSFIYGVSRRNFQNAPELTKIGIGLLKNFPAARDAVLEYFAMVFHDAVNISLNQDYEQDSSNNGSLESVGMIGPELCNMGESWAPFIAPWCINLIMDIATDKANLPNTTLQNTDPIRVLLDITTQNLTLLNAEERAKCIDMMLGCRACSWAVGWVGRAEPALVAPRALALAPDAARAVLAHLANHPPALYHVRAALVDLFQEAIREDGSPEKKREVIPYLLNLASKSDIVLKALTQDIENTLTAAVVSRLQAVSPRWEGACGGGASGGGGAGALVALLLRCDARCYLLLLHHAQWNTFCRHLLEQLLQKLEYENLFPESNIPLLTSAAEEINILREKLLVGNKLEQYSIARILILVSYNFPSEFVSTISYLLQHSRSDGTLALLVRLLAGTSNMHIPNDDVLDTDRYQNFIKTGVEYALRDAMIADTQVKKCFIEGNIAQDQKTYLHHLCLNIVTLLRWENSGRVSALRTRSVSRAVEASVYRVGAALRERACDLRARQRDTAGALSDMPTCHALAQVLDRIDLTGTKSPPPSVEAILKIVQATVKYFFRCLFEEDIMRKISGVQTACGLLRKVCAHSKVARGAALRELLDAALFRYDKVFASTTTAQQSPAEELLLYMNRKHGPITQLTQSHTSVFHAGVLARGGRRGASPAAEAPRILAPDNELLMGAIMSCMEGSGGIVEGATSVSLLLVELISPDVMYNGLPWPDEDFTKQVSIERELYMRCAVERCGVARAALRRAARARPALCLAAALLRASAASLLHRLRAHLDRHTQSTEMSRELAALTELLTLMTLGQLLPHPLTHMLEMAPELTASETVQVLRDCLWNYTRDHVPSPALFSCDSTGLHWRDPSTCKPPAQYTDTLRIIIQKRISKLGHMYPIMFLNLEKET